jgi:hypothetical protein
MSAPNYIPMLHISPETQRLLRSVSFKGGSYSAGHVRKSLSHWIHKQYIHSWPCKSTAGCN